MFGPLYLIDTVFSSHTHVKHKLRDHKASEDREVNWPGGGGGAGASAEAGSGPRPALSTCLTSAVSLKFTLLRLLTHKREVITMTASFKIFLGLIYGLISSSDGPSLLHRDCLSCG